MTDQELRERLVERLERAGVLTDARVESAVLGVPRHRFIPAVSETEAYEDRALALKERGGAVISSISQPSMIVQMLQMLDVHRGQSVLEIGTGSGYNAALLASLTGPTGRVVTLEIEPDLIQAASTRFFDLGYTNVDVRTPEALDAIEEPFDRIVVTARTSDIDGVWWHLLKDTGHIVVPLDIGYGGERAIGFVREGALLRSLGSYACAFIGIRGNSAQTQHAEYFFPNREARYVSPPVATAPIAVVAVQHADATPSLLEDADVIVARPHTIFALRF